MRRAERLFQIIQILRRSTLPVTGAALAAELEVSTRTVYRDVGAMGPRWPRAMRMVWRRHGIMRDRESRSAYRVRAYSTTACDRSTLRARCG